MIESVKIPEMRTISQTAKLFQLPEHFVRKKVLSGEVVAVRAGVKYLVNISKFAEYLDTATIQQEQETQTLGKIQPIRL